jgi:RHS repeat-associated protein
LIGVVTTSSGTTTQTVNYIYDAMDRRIGKQVFDGSGTRTVDERYALDGSGLAEVFNSAGTVQQRYFDNPNTGQALAEETPARTGDVMRWLLADREGTVKEVINNAGASTTDVLYDGYGNMVATLGTEALSRFGYTGQEQDAETGFTHNAARYYDPKDGQFISQDPSGLGPDANPYRYAGNNPVDFTDPTGLFGSRTGAVSLSTLGLSGPVQSSGFSFLANPLPQEAAPSFGDQMAAAHGPVPQAPPSVDSFGGPLGIGRNNDAKLKMQIIPLEDGSSRVVITSGHVDDGGFWYGGDPTFIGTNISSQTVGPSVSHDSIVRAFHGMVDSYEQFNAALAEANDKVSRFDSMLTTLPFGTAARDVSDNNVSWGTVGRTGADVLFFVGGPKGAGSTFALGGTAQPFVTLAAGGTVAKLALAATATGVGGYNVYQGRQQILNGNYAAGISQASLGLASGGYGLQAGQAALSSQTLIRPVQTMATGREWYDALSARYGAGNVEWTSGSGVTMQLPAGFPMPQGRLFRIDPPPRSGSFASDLEIALGSRPLNGIAHHDAFLQLNGEDNAFTNGSWANDAVHKAGHGVTTPAINSLPFGTEVIFKR